MASISHEAAIREQINRAVRPPINGRATRKCQGFRIIAAYTKPDGTYVEQRTEPCRAGCIVWLPELSYCASHIPVRFLSVAHNRGALWASLVDDIWAQVCAEYPIPPEELA
jgi:hypothetical protein